MQIRSVTITNFRGYKEPTVVDFNDLTVFVGRNDVGKSTILEALDLFFNDGKSVVKYDKGDVCIHGFQNEYSIGIVFCDIPKTVVIDSSYETTLAEEYLLNEAGDLEIVKVFNGLKNTGIYIRALHPSDSRCNDLHLKKKNELRALLKEYKIECDNQSINSVMRQAIWKRFENNLDLKLKDIDINSGEDTKKIWSKISTILPMYSLFQSDRQNSDGDKEVQDPLKIAVTQFFQDEKLQEILKNVADQVSNQLQEVANRTLQKLREMDSTVADSLNPVIPSSTNLKWAEVFTKVVSITSDNDIPINKRGSGVKRLILLNFFRAEAERRQKEGCNTGVIYAIEEPETSQHFANQRVLIKALIALSKTPNTQVILTSHSGVIVKELRYDDLRLILEVNDKKCIKHVPNGLLNYPSMNEVNYIAFREVTEEYHDELYGYIQEQNWLHDYEDQKPQIPYVRQLQNGTTRNEMRTLTHFIRDVMHHPENTHNRKYTFSELEQSIIDMRTFIASKEEGESTVQNECV